MKLRLAICLLLSWVVVVVVGRALQQQVDEVDAGKAGEVLRMVEALGLELQGVATDQRDDSWLIRYQQLQQSMNETNKISQELVKISRKLVPLIWSIHMGNVMMASYTHISKGRVAGPGFSFRGPAPPPPPPKFLFIHPSNLTVRDSFVAQAVVLPKAEANVGFCLYYAPEEGQQLDFDNGDIFIAAHVRWHFDYGNSREIAFNDRYNGVWSRPEKTFGGPVYWPDFQVGERFLISVTSTTESNCFQILVILGRELHNNKPFPRPTYYFCPKHRRSGDPRKLILTVNEDRPGANEIQVQWTTSFKAI